MDWVVVRANGFSLASHHCNSQLLCLSSLSVIITIVSRDGVNLSSELAKWDDSVAGLGIDGVEPEGAQSMALSLANGKAMWCPEGGKTETIAHGLAPPFAGRATYNHVARFCDAVVTVTDDEMREATRALFRMGIVAEATHPGIDPLPPSKIAAVPFSGLH